MEIKRRFVFHGNAAPFGGRLVRPADVVIGSNGASSLPVTGGRWRSEIQGGTYGVIHVGSASTLVEGLFDDVTGALKEPLGPLDHNALTATTNVNAEVLDVRVGQEPHPVLTVARLHAALTSRSPAGSGEPAISLGDKSIVEKAAINGHTLVVELNTPVFQEHDTHSKLRTAADNEDFVRDHGHCLFMNASFEGRPAPPAGRLVEGRMGIYATIVKKISWDGEPFDGAHIDHHVVVVPDFGKIYFGEILITRYSRRLTMMRLELGSPDGGEAAFAEVDTNGSWSP
jgi:hypothetical protein